MPIYPSNQDGKHNGRGQHPGEEPQPDAIQIKISVKWQDIGQRRADGVVSKNVSCTKHQK